MIKRHFSVKNIIILACTLSCLFTTAYTNDQEDLKKLADIFFYQQRCEINTATAAVVETVAERFREMAWLQLTMEETLLDPIKNIPDNQRARERHISKLETQRAKQKRIITQTTPLIQRCTEEFKELVQRASEQGTQNHKIFQQLADAEEYNTIERNEKEPHALSVLRKKNNTNLTFF